MSLTSVSPLDGRYESIVQKLSPYFSEYALMKHRVQAEVIYFEIILIEYLRHNLSEEENQLLQKLYDFDLEDATIIQAIEKKGYEGIPATNHDMKAIEYYLKIKLKGSPLEHFSEYIHFGITSDDINNIAYASMIAQAINQQVLPLLEETYSTIYTLAHKYAETPMLARTHGQAATPVTFGKELLVFVARIKTEIEHLAHTKIYAKLNGATGSYNALVAVASHINWQNISKLVIKKANETLHTNAQTYFSTIKIEIAHNPITTQIEPYDGLARIFDSMKRLNTIFIDFSQDIWRYISDGWLTQKVVEGEIGSSAMPHKVNPIDFENAEGNLGLSNALFSFFSTKLPISRLQRDLSDSTVKRSFGSAFGYMVIALSSIIKGLNKIAVHETTMHNALEENPQVLAEAYQTILRAEGVEKPYELLKNITRGKQMCMKDFIAFIDTLQVDKSIKEKLKAFTPHNYLGLSTQIINEFNPYVKLD